MSKLSLTHAGKEGLDRRQRQRSESNSSRLSNSWKRGNGTWKYGNSIPEKTLIMPRRRRRRRQKIHTAVYENTKQTLDVIGHFYPNSPFSLCRYYSHFLCHQIGNLLGRIRICTLEGSSMHTWRKFFVISARAETIIGGEREAVCR